MSPNPMEINAMESNDFSMKINDFPTKSNGKSMNLSLFVTRQSCNIRERPVTGNTNNWVGDCMLIRIIIGVYVLRAWDVLRTVLNLKEIAWASRYVAVSGSKKIKYSDLCIFSTPVGLRYGNRVFGTYTTYTWSIPEKKLIQKILKNSMIFMVLFRDEQM